MTSWFAETVLAGSLVLALPIAALAGLVSFLSPCVLPLVPGYLGYVTGLSAAQVAGGHRGRVLAGTALFVAGFSVVFVAYGLLFGTLGELLIRHGDTIMRGLGVVVIVLGLVFAGWLPGLSGEWRAQWHPVVGLSGAPLLGAALGLGWTPCLGPTLAAVQALAFNEASAGRGALLSLAYCLGLGVPFLAAAVAFGRSARTIRWLRQRQRLLMRAGGLLLVLLGLALVTGLWSFVVSWLQGWISGFEVAI